MRNIKPVSRGRHRTLVGLVLLVAAAGAVGAEPAAEQPIDGASLFASHCANCHGTFGEGDGILAPSLSVVLQDLRYLTVRNSGEYPRDFIVEIIDGRAGRAEHGPEGMPVWGAEFARHEPFDAQTEARVSAKIEALADYLESIQITGATAP